MFTNIFPQKFIFIGSMSDNASNHLEDNPLDSSISLIIGTPTNDNAIDGSSNSLRITKKLENTDFVLLSDDTLTY